MLSEQQITNRVKQIIVEHLAVSEAQLIDTALFVENLGADSLDAMDLLLAINEEFNIHLSAEQMDQIHTVADMVEAVKQALANKKH